MLHPRPSASNTPIATILYPPTLCSLLCPTQLIWRVWFDFESASCEAASIKPTKPQAPTSPQRASIQHSRAISHTSQTRPANPFGSNSTPQEGCATLAVYRFDPDLGEQLPFPTAIEPDKLIIDKTTALHGAKSHFHSRAGERRRPGRRQDWCKTSKVPGDTC